MKRLAVHLSKTEANRIRMLEAPVAKTLAELTFPVVLTINSLSLGIGMGAVAAISRAIGSRDNERVRRLKTGLLFRKLVSEANRWSTRQHLS